MSMVLWLFLRLFFSLVIGYYANEKGRNMWAWGIAALVFTPIIVGIILALMPDNTDKDSGKSATPSSNGSYKDDTVEEVRCPECGYLADAGEQYCPRCGEMLW
ncbi:MAG: zinc ribbon domain-containing protein [Schwartzia sp.]|nr:zinc ribbon domain-containing protein [Schwartzia sp. (in: firmicutes)]